MSERLKYIKFKNLRVDTYFWRTTQMQEIDYLEVSNDSLSAYEFKYSSKSKFNFSKTFTNNYNTVITKLINKNNFYEFLSDVS